MDEDMIGTWVYLCLKDRMVSLSQEWWPVFDKNGGQSETGMVASI
jgi:hypothetical protein